jgi:hypothetical protein
MKNVHVALTPTEENIMQKFSKMTNSSKLLLIARDLPTTANNFQANTQTSNLTRQD